MKQQISTLVLALLALLVVSCAEENADVRPGLWTADDVIETYPGDTVLVEGQVSNYVGMSTVTLSCDAWNVNKVYALKGNPKVFNYSWQLAVPGDATFDQELKVTVTDKNGSENKKTIMLTYKADTEAPQITSTLLPQISIDIENVGDTVHYLLDMDVQDDRELERAFVSIPALDVNDTVLLTGRYGKICQDIAIAKGGRFDMTVIVEDRAGNRKEATSQLIVAAPEVENPFSDYAQMYVVNADEQASDYLSGYYRYMDRTDAYQYSCKFYAPKDGTHVYFVPAQSMTGDLFGVSPNVSTKLMNNNGYVVPVTIDKAGYYYLWVDLQNHQYKVTPYEVESTVYKGDLTVTGTGFADMADWGFSGNMNPAGSSYRRQITLNIADGYASDYSYCVTDGSWTRVWRCSEGKWWWLDD